MRINVFGLGYVGCVSAGCLARLGHAVTALDINRDKLADISAGRSPVQEPGLSSLIAAAVGDGLLQATDDAAWAVARSELSLVCVGTPSAPGGALDLQYVERVCAQIGTALRHAPARHTVVLRSTVLPGTTEEAVIPILNRTSGRRAGRDFGVCYNPEFLREGVAVHDFLAPSRIVIGQLDTASGDALAPLYQSLHAPVIRTTPRVAEMVKYTDNAFHGVKVAFANEIGNLCAALAIDSHEVMEIFALDTALNLGPAYLQPGFAFGGSCLPKDLRALLHRACQAQVVHPLLSAVFTSNEQQKQRGLEMIRRAGHRRIGILGVSNKNGTDDLRESPAVEVLAQLLSEGYDVMAYDHNVLPAAIVGANREYVERQLPRWSSLLCPTLEQLLAHAETVVIAARHDEFADVLDQLRPDQVVVDLVRIRRAHQLGTRYAGLCW
ncbi:MAG: GDP-mannose 6-dehydrogenase [Deltaproteobacteria bacterium]|nr:GDP-mannose 6-dehydrogenase [Deltaproteobacteria bacterium]